MKWISNLFGSLRSLASSFGLIYLLMALAVVGGIGGTLFTLEGAFGDTWLYIDLLNTLHSDARYNLLEMDLSENRYFLSDVKGEADQTALASAQNHYSRLQESLDEISFRVKDYPEVFSEDWVPWLEDIQAELTDHQASFEQLAEEINTLEEPDWDFYYQVIDENIALQAGLTELINEVNQERVLTALDTAFDIRISVMLLSILLVLLLVLALWGYRTINAMLQPLPILTNAVMAIAGQQYQAELLANLNKRRSLSGKFSRSLAHLAQTVQQRDADLHAEVHQAQQELYESRRQRLKIARPTENDSGKRGGAR